MSVEKGSVLNAVRGGVQGCEPFSGWWEQVRVSLPQGINLRDGAAGHLAFRAWKVIVWIPDGCPLTYKEEQVREPIGAADEAMVRQIGRTIPGGRRSSAWRTPCWWQGCGTAPRCGVGNPRPRAG